MSKRGKTANFLPQAPLMALGKNKPLLGATRTAAAAAGSSSGGGSKLAAAATLRQQQAAAAAAHALQQQQQQQAAAAAAAAAAMYQTAGAAGTAAGTGGWEANQSYFIPSAPAAAAAAAAPIPGGDMDMLMTLPPLPPLPPLPGLPPVAGEDLLPPPVAPAAVAAAAPTFDRVTLPFANGTSSDLLGGSGGGSTPATLSAPAPTATAMSDLAIPASVTASPFASAAPDSTPAAAGSTANASAAGNDASANRNNSHADSVFAPNSSLSLLFNAPAATATPASASAPTATATAAPSSGLQVSASAAAAAIAAAAAVSSTPSAADTSRLSAGTRDSYAQYLQATSGAAGLFGFDPSFGAPPYLPAAPLPTPQAMFAPLDMAAVWQAQHHQHQQQQRQQQQQQPAMYFPPQPQYNSAPHYPFGYTPPLPPPSQQQQQQQQQQQWPALAPQRPTDYRPNSAFPPLQALLNGPAASAYPSTPLPPLMPSVPKATPAAAAAAAAAKPKAATTAVAKPASTKANSGSITSSVFGGEDKSKWNSLSDVVGARRRSEREILNHLQHMHRKRWERRTGRVPTAAAATNGAATTSTASSSSAVAAAATNSAIDTFAAPPATPAPKQAKPTLRAVPAKSLFFSPSSYVGASKPKTPSVKTGGTTAVAAPAAAPPPPPPSDVNDDTCTRCREGGDLVCCDTCPRSFHAECIALKVVPEGKWACPVCAKSMSEEVVDGFRFFSFDSAELAFAKDAGFYCDASKRQELLNAAAALDGGGVGGEDSSDEELDQTIMPVVSTPTKAKRKRNETDPHALNLEIRMSERKFTLEDMQTLACLVQYDRNDALASCFLFYVGQICSRAATNHPELSDWAIRKCATRSCAACQILSSRSTRNLNVAIASKSMSDEVRAASSSTSSSRRAALPSTDADADAAAVASASKFTIGQLAKMTHSNQMDGAVAAATAAPVSKRRKADTSANAGGGASTAGGGGVSTGSSDGGVVMVQYPDQDPIRRVVKNIIKELKVNQKDLASQIHLNPTMLSRWLSDRATGSQMMRVAPTVRAWLYRFHPSGLVGLPAMPSLDELSGLGQPPQPQQPAAAAAATPTAAATAAATNTTPTAATAAATTPAALSAAS